jgi:hypothetical protein
LKDPSFSSGWVRGLSAARNALAETTLCDERVRTVDVVYSMSSSTTRFFWRSQSNRATLFWQHAELIQPGSVNLVPPLHATLD